LVSIFAAGYVIKTQRRSENTTERALVFSYLQAFDVEDVDVRHSATGGWHGTYVGKLAQGEGMPQSHSSIVKDHLFVDYESSSKPKGGLEEEDYDEDYDEDYNDDDDDDDNVEDDDFDAMGSLSYMERKDNLSDQGSQSDQGSLTDQDITSDPRKKGDPWGRDII
jgi:hypothetical protein